MERELNKNIMSPTTATKKELILQLREMLNNLPYRDRDQLASFKARADEVIKRFNGKITDYRYQLQETRFAPWSLNPSDEEYKKSWELGTAIVLNLLQAIENDSSLTISQSSEIPVENPSTQSAVPADCGSDIQIDSIQNEGEQPQSNTSPGDVLNQPGEPTEVLANPPQQETVPLEKQLTDEDFVQEKSQDIEPPATVSQGQTQNLPSPLNEERNADRRDEQFPRDYPVAGWDFSKFRQQLKALAKFLFLKIKSFIQARGSVPSSQESIESPQVSSPENETVNKETISTPPSNITLVSPEPSVISAAPDDVENVSSPVLPQEQQTPTVSLEPVPAGEASQKESVPSQKFSTRIMLLHGSNEVMENKVVAVLTQLGFEIIFSNDAENFSKPFIQKFAEYSDAAFCVALLSFDINWYPKDQKPKDAKFSSHQNVVFELGYMIGKFGRNRVFVLYDEKKNFELPSNFFNAYYIPYDRERAWHVELIKVFNDHGYKADIKQLRF